MKIVENVVDFVDIESFTGWIYSVQAEIFQLALAMTVDTVDSEAVSPRTRDLREFVRRFVAVVNPLYRKLLCFAW